MKLVRQLLDYGTDWKLPDVYLFTGNPVIKQNGAIVMGRGAAKQVRDRWPGLDQIFGQLIHEHPDRNVISVVIGEEQVIGWFKVKDHWAEPAKLSLISDSCQSLTAMAVTSPDLTFHLNFPGVGNGRLTEEEVLPVLETMPDNVIVYR